MEFIVLGNTLTLVSILGALAAITMIVTEMIKEVWLISKIPTRFTALIVAECVTMGAMVVYLQGAEVAFAWWYLIIAFFAAFVVGYLSINGWDTFYEIWQRFVSGSKGGKKDERN